MGDFILLLKCLNVFCNRKNLKLGSFSSTQGPHEQGIGQRISVFGRILCSLQAKSQSNDVYCKKHRPEEQEHDKDYGNGLAPVEPEDQIHEDAKMA